MVRHQHPCRQQFRPRRSFTFIRSATARLSRFRHPAVRSRHRGAVRPLPDPQACAAASLPFSASWPVPSAALQTRNSVVPWTFLLSQKIKRRQRISVVAVAGAAE